MGTDVLVVLAAGSGRRFGGCKQLAPVGPNGEVLLNYVVAGAAEAGFARVVVVTRPDLEVAVRAQLSRGGGSAVAVELVLQGDGARGTVPAVLAARPLLADDEPLGVVNADDLYPRETFQALRAWDSPGHALVGFCLAGTMLPGSGTVNRALCQLDDAVDHRPAPLAPLPPLPPLPALPSLAGVARLAPSPRPARPARQGRLARLVEAAITEHDGGFVARELGGNDDTPVAGDVLVSMNAWVFAPSIWAGLGSAAEACAGAGEVLLPVVVGELILRGEATVTVVPMDGRCAGLTWPGDLATVQALVRRLVATGQLPALGGPTPE